MLKPRKKITRRELKKDPLLEALYSLQKLYDRSKRAVRIALIGGAGAFLIFLMISGWRSSVRQSAGESFARGLSRYEAGDWASARDDFEILHSEYGRTQAGVDALYYLGQIHLEFDDQPSAIDAFQEYTRKGKNVFLKAAAYESLANLASADGNYVEAARLFQKAASLPTFPFNRQQNKINAADCWLKAGRSDKARPLLDELKSTENVNRLIQDQIDELSAHFVVAAQKSS